MTSCTSLLQTQLMYWCIRGYCREMFPELNTLAEMALVIQVSSVCHCAAYLQNNIHTSTRSLSSWTKVQNLVTITCHNPTFDYTQAGAQFRSMQTRRKFEDCAFRPQQIVRFFKCNCFISLLIIISNFYKS